MAACELITCAPTTEHGKNTWPDPFKDNMFYVANPLEADLPGHWVPISVVKKVVEWRVTELENTYQFPGLPNTGIKAKLKKVSDNHKLLKGQISSSDREALKFPKFKPKIKPKPLVITTRAKRFPTGRKITPAVKHMSTRIASKSQVTPKRTLSTHISANPSTIIATTSKQKYLTKITSKATTASNAVQTTTIMNNKNSVASRATPESTDNPKITKAVSDNHKPTTSSIIKDVSKDIKTHEIDVNAEININVDITANIEQTTFTTPDSVNNVTEQEDDVNKLNEDVSTLEGISTTDVDNNNRGLVETTTVSIDNNDITSKKTTVEESGDPFY